MYRGNGKKRRRRVPPTRGAAKTRLVSQGVGFWTNHDGEWCVRIAGDFRAGDRVRVMSNAGRIADAFLGDAVPNTRFQWMNSEGHRVDGQLFRRWKGQRGGEFFMQDPRKTAAGATGKTVGAA